MRSDLGQPLQRLKALVPDRIIKVLPGRFNDKQAVRTALAENGSSGRRTRYFCEHPMVDQGADATYVLHKVWGGNPEPTLQKLAEAFAEANVTLPPCGKTRRLCASGRRTPTMR